MYFDYHISVLVGTLLGVLFVFSLFIVTIYRARVNVPVKCRARLDDAPLDGDSAAEPVSVVVYARDNSARLERLLNELLEQDYPAGFEVIVVNDSGGYACSDVVTRLALTHSNLRMTFVPENAHNLSRKKLAITLGMKAARNKFVLILNAECHLPSRLWLASMARDPQRVTLGHAVISADDDSQLPLMMRFDEAASAIRWISAAGRNRAFRGNGYNIAYPAATFFAKEGFSGTLNLQAGDDDLFVNKIANKDNTRVELSADSVVSIKTSQPKRLYRELKISHVFTGRQLPSQPVMALAPVVMWLSLALAVAATWLAFPNAAVGVAALVLVLAQWIVTGIYWHRGAEAVGISVSAWQVIPALLLHPFHNLRYRIASRSNKSQHYTWQKQKKI